MKITKTTWYFILLLPFIEPQIFKTPGFEIIDKIYLVFKLVASLFIIIEYITKINFSATKYVIIMVFSQIVIFISTYLNNGSITRFLGPALISVVCIMLGELASKSNMKKFLVYIEKYLTLLFSMNLFTLILQVVGIYPFRATLLGIENRWIYTMLPWTVIAFINSYLKYKKIVFHAWLIYFASVISLVIKWSAGAMMSFLMFPFVLWLSKFIIKKRGAFEKVSSRTMFFIILTINYLLVGGYIIGLLEPIIVNYLHKSITLTGRTFLWEAVIDILESKPLLGAGVQSNEFDMIYFFRSSGRVNGTAVNHPHNHCLNIAYHGGFIALGLFLLEIFLVMNAIDKNRDVKIKRIFFTSTVIIFVAALIDTLDFSLFYLLIPIITNSVGLNEKRIKIKLD